MTTTRILLALGAALFAQRAPAQETGLWGPSSEDLVLHYARVEVELLAADVAHLSEVQKAARARAIGDLRRYRERGVFGVNLRFPGERKLLFVDDGGRRCAVAELLHCTGRDDLVERIASQNNYAYVCELGGDPALAEWLREVGLSLDEAARIQGPHGGGGGWPETAGRPAAGGTWDGPGDTVGPTGPSTGASRPTTPAGPGASTPGPVVPGSAGAPPAAGGPSTPASRTSHEVGAEAWWTWWELHKLDYLRPNMIRNWVATVTGWNAGDGHYPAKELELVRHDVRPVVERLLREGDAQVRAAAALALGRIAGDEAVEPLTAALGDASMLVRERAILAMGATGSEAAARVLIDLAEDGRLAGDTGRVSPDAREIALIALGIGRRNGFDESLDREVTRLASTLDGASVETALVCYQTLNPTPVLEDWSLARAGDRRASDAVRCRSLETLRFRDDDEALVKLLHSLSGRELELRRSAALALGEMDHDRVLEPLLTAAEVEREPLARAFVLLSIGRQGGESARDFLIDYLKNGKKSHRAWCAIALGILAREDDDALARKTLRARFKTERNQESRGAWYLALGIAGCEDGFEILRDGLVEGATPETRSAAAFGLAMIGGDESREVLLAQLDQDVCPYTRAVIAQSLGYVGDRRDAPALLATLSDITHPSLQSQLSLALGLHGSREALEGLVAIAKEESVAPSTRAAALEAMQLLVGTGPNLTLGELLRQTNFAVFPAALVRHLTVPI